MRRTFVILVILPLTFALLPLAAVLMTAGSPAPDATLVLEQGPGSSAAPAGAPAGVATWDAAEFGGKEGVLTFRAAEGKGEPRDCDGAPQG